MFFPNYVQWEERHHSLSKNWFSTSTAEFLVSSPLLRETNQRLSGVGYQRWRFSCSDTGLHLFWCQSKLKSATDTTLTEYEKNIISLTDSAMMFSLQYYLLFFLETGIEVTVKKESFDYIKYLSIQRIF